MRSLVGIVIALAVYGGWRLFKEYGRRWIQRDFEDRSREYGVPLEFLDWNEHFQIIDVRDGRVLEEDDEVV